jgi:hypothetical protein
MKFTVGSPSRKGTKRITLFTSDEQMIETEKGAKGNDDVLEDSFLVNHIAEFIIAMGDIASLGQIQNHLEGTLEMSNERHMMSLHLLKTYPMKFCVKSKRQH